MMKATIEIFGFNEMDYLIIQKKYDEISKELSSKSKTQIMFTNHSEI